MMGQVARRVASGVFVLFLVSMVVFALLQLGQGNAARAAAGGLEATQSDIAAARIRLGLDRPIVEQYLNWAGGMLRGDLGNSYVSGRPVASLVAARLGTTVALALCSVLVGSVIAIVIGVFAASRPNGLLDKSLTVLSSIGIATPPFVIAIFMVSYLAVTTSLFPATGYVPLSASPAQWFIHMVLPVATLAIALAAELSRYVRASVRDVLRSEYVELLRLQGFGERTILFRYALKGAAVPFTTVIGLQLSHLLGGIVVVETIFDISGIGSLAVQAVLNNDLPVVAAVAVVICTMILVVNLGVDIVHKVLDPRAVMA